MRLITAVAVLTSLGLFAILAGTSDGPRGALGAAPAPEVVTDSLALH